MPKDVIIQIVKEQDAPTQSALIPKKSKSLHPSLTDDIPSKTWFHMSFKTRRYTSIISTFDVMLGLFERRWFALKNFHEHKVPSWGSGIFNMLPSLIVWSILLREWINRKPDEVTPDLGATKSFLKQFKKLKNTSQELEKHENEKYQFHGMLHAFNYPGNNIYIDFMLGNFILGLRFLNGVLFMLQTIQLTSSEKNKEITDISSDIFTMINVLYTSYMILHNTKERPLVKADDFFFSTNTITKAIKKFKEYGKRRHQKDLQDHGVSKAVDKFKEMGERYRQRKQEENNLRYMNITPLQKFSNFNKSHSKPSSGLYEHLLPELGVSRSRNV